MSRFILFTGDQEPCDFPDQATLFQADPANGSNVFSRKSRRWYVIRSDGFLRVDESEVPKAHKAWVLILT